MRQAAAGVFSGPLAFTPYDLDAPLAQLWKQLEARAFLPTQTLDFTRSLANTLLSDPDWPDCDIEANYLALVAELEGRAAPVSFATHDPRLARSALAMLARNGTPCELEQLRGLPAHRTTAVAHKLGVTVRRYIPYGPGWWPSAIDKAWPRPYLPIWWAQDLLGLKQVPGGL